MRLSKLVNALEYAEIVFRGEDWEREIGELSADSRIKAQNSLFVCLCGGSVDSHEHATEAVENGAVAVITQKRLPVSVPQVLVKDARVALAILASVFYGEPSKRLKVIGITGTNGKTTTSHMLASILEEAGKKVGVIGTLGVRYARKNFRAELTTPDPIALQRTLADMLLCGVEYAVMEVSAHALFYQKTAGVRFSACIFTNFTQDHLDFFHTMSAYRQAKLGLFSPKICPLAIVNGDEETGREISRIRENTNGTKTVLYGLNTPSDCFAIVTDESINGSECMLNINDKLCRISLKMTGRHNIYNALAAAACAVELGITAKSVEAGLSNIHGVCGRLEKTALFRGAEIFIDFAHTPDGLGKSLDALRKHCKGRLVCLFGCGGNRDKTKRPIMGETAARKADFTVLTSDNPRYEDPLDIISDIEKGYRRFSSRFVIVPDRKKAVDYALDYLKSGDILLVAGKGGEDYQEIMGIKYPFDDHDIIGKLLEQKGKNPLS